MDSTYTFSDEQFADCNGMKLCYQTIGDVANPPMLLVMGLGVQMIGWPDRFCQMLAERGFFVIRYDNRDVGRSTQLDHVKLPQRRQMLGSYFFGRTFPVAYTLEDMAADAFGLLDALNIDKAHVVGISMGGMIAQIMALRHPNRLLSLTSIMSSTSEHDLPNATPRAIAMLIAPRSSDLDTYIEKSTERYRYLNRDTFTFDEERTRNDLRLAYSRNSSPFGVARHLGAVGNTPGRRQALRAVTTPTLVIHGDADPLVPYQHGVDTAEAIPTARLFTIRGMGHTLPSEAWPTIVGEIAVHACTQISH